MNGDVLKKLRLEYNLTQDELAKKVGLSASTIRMIELGNRQGSHKTINILAKYFNVSIDFLEGRTELRNNDNHNNNTFSIIDNLLNELISNGTIKDYTNIDDDTFNIIKDALKIEIALKMNK